jgi:hypothetical protein
VLRDCAACDFSIRRRHKCRSRRAEKSPGGRQRVRVARVV